jgi:hypothetical protein
MKGFPIHTKSDEGPKVEPNRYQRRAQAALDRKEHRKTVKALERQAKVAYERTRLVSKEEAETDYDFG